MKGPESDDPELARRHEQLMELKAEAEASATRLAGEMDEAVATLRVLAPAALASIAEQWVAVVMRLSPDSTDQKRAQAEGLKSAYLNLVRTDLGVAPPFEEIVAESRRQSRETQQGTQSDELW
jgi:hypothetical protein